MSTLTGVSYTDFASRLDPDNKIRTIIELLAQTNPILEDMVIVEGNLQTGHKTTIRSGLPTVTWRLLNYGVQPSKSITSQITDTCGMLEAYAEVDKALADLNGNSAAWRLSEDRAFLEAMNQAMATTSVYGSVLTYPERFTGVNPRYAAVGTDSTVSTYNTVSAYSSASGSDQTSMLLIVWGENTVHGIYPKGSVAGFQHEDKGQVTLLDAADGRYEGYRSHYKWDLGLTVRDWRYCVRVCNIDTSAITTSTVDLFAAMIDAYERIPDVNMGRPVFYCNRTVRSWLWKQAAAKSNVNLTIDQPAGKPILSFNGIPIKRNDSILNTESVVS
ncbi:MAG: major capsid protein [bacterium]